MIGGWVGGMMIGRVSEIVRVRVSFHRTYLSYLQYRIFYLFLSSIINHQLSIISHQSPENKTKLTEAINGAVIHPRQTHREGSRGA